MKKVLLILSGSIAVYKVLEFVRHLKKQSAVEITSVLTSSAEKFITPLSLAALSEGKVYTAKDCFNADYHLLHLSLTRDHHEILAFAASANFIAKIAQGHADELATTLLIGSKQKAIFAPAMNPEMWQQQAFQGNLEMLQEQGHRVIMPDEGMTLCQEQGLGRLANFGRIEAALFNKHKHLDGKTIVILSGATFEAIDAVRGITNPSSGKQGLALYHVLKNQGADIDMICGWRHEGLAQINEPIHAHSAGEMYERLLEILETKSIDILISVAAVSDCKPKHSHSHKIKKQNLEQQLDLEPTIDILKSLSTHPKRPKLVIGFAAESENLEAHALEKLQSKNLNLIVANDISNNQAFGKDDNQVCLLSKDAAPFYFQGSKLAIAEKISDFISKQC